MNWMLVAGVFGAGTLAQFTDWLFMGVLFHDAYNRYPEVWWPGVREGKERRAIIWASLIGYVMTARDLRSVRMVGACIASPSGLAVACSRLDSPGRSSIIVINGFFITHRPENHHCPIASAISRALPFAGAIERGSSFPSA